MGGQAEHGNWIPGGCGAVGTRYLEVVAPWLALRQITSRVAHLRGNINGNSMISLKPLYIFQSWPGEGKGGQRSRFIHIEVTMTD